MKKIKFYYSNQTLYYFCKNNQLNYRNVVRSLLYYQNKNSDYSIDFLIKKVIEKYLKIKENKRIIFFIHNLEKTQKWNFNLISRSLNIEYSSLYRVYHRGFTKREAFYIVWFLYDSVSVNHKIKVSNSKLKEFISIYQSKNYTSNMPFLFLLVLYKIDKRKILDVLLQKREKQLTRFLQSLLSNSSEIEDLKQDILLHELTLYDKLALNHVGQIMRYLNLHAKNLAFRLAKKEMSLHLEDNINHYQNYLDVLDNHYLSGDNYVF